MAIWTGGHCLANARVAELADAPDLGSGSERIGGSNPLARTIPPLDECSTSSDHGFAQEPRTFLQSRTRFEPKTWEARTRFS